MELFGFLPLWQILAGTLAIPLFLLLSDIYKWARLPPGPIPFPFIGNTLPASKPWIKFQEYASKYGPIFTIWVGRRPTIIISDPEIAVELMEKRSPKYSSRPRLVVMGEMYSSGSVLVQPYGKDWSLRRKLLHRALTPAALKTYKSRQEAESTRLISSISENPDHWEKSFERFTASVVFSIAYGHRIDSLDAPVIKQQLHFMQFMASLNVPGAYLAESFPILKYVPQSLAPWKREIYNTAALSSAATIELVEGVRRDLQSGKEKGVEVPPSLAQTLLGIKETEGVSLSDRDFSNIPVSLFGAGSDTTASTLCSAILALVTHPEALKVAQTELDNVVGIKKMPTFEDEIRLPYLRALVKEVLRWRPVAVLGGTPHASTENDVYNGYHIPAGTTILGNSWAINLNEYYYTNPHLFNPARFLDESDPRFVSELKAKKAHPAKAGHSSFGWGRRICPGAELATNSLFIAISKLIWAFDILPIGTYDTFDYTEGFNSRPRSFRCEIRLRSEAHSQILKREMINAEREMSRFPAYD